MEDEGKKMKRENDEAIKQIRVGLPIGDDEPQPQNHHNSCHHDAIIPLLSIVLMARILRLGGKVDNIGVVIPALATQFISVMFPNTAAVTNVKNMTNAQTVERCRAAGQYLREKTPGLLNPLQFLCVLVFYMMWKNEQIATPHELPHTKLEVLNAALTLLVNCAYLNATMHSYDIQPVHPMDKVAEEDEMVLVGSSTETTGNSTMLDSDAGDSNNVLEEEEKELKTPTMLRFGQTSLLRDVKIAWEKAVAFPDDDGPLWVWEEVWANDGDVTWFDLSNIAGVTITASNHHTLHLWTPPCADGELPYVTLYCGLLDGLSVKGVSYELHQKAFLHRTDLETKQVTCSIVQPLGVSAVGFVVRYNELDVAAVDKAYYRDIYDIISKPKYPVANDVRDDSLVQLPPPVSPPQPNAGTTPDTALSADAQQTPKKRGRGATQNATTPKTPPKTTPITQPTQRTTRSALARQSNSNTTLVNTTPAKNLKDIPRVYRQVDYNPTDLLLPPNISKAQQRRVDSGNTKLVEGDLLYIIPNYLEFPYGVYASAIAKPQQKIAVKIPRFDSIDPTLSIEIGTARYVVSKTSLAVAANAAQPKTGSIYWWSETSASAPPSKRVPVAPKPPICMFI